MPDAAGPSALGTSRSSTSRSSAASFDKATEGDQTPHGRLVACTRRVASADSGIFGPQGGVLVIGSNRLTIPPGALTRRVMIKGAVVGDTVAYVQFEPHGLTFRRPAGLVLDASGCNVGEERVPDVVYIDVTGAIAERIDATYSNAWHTVAAPINHFSGYGIAF